VPDDGPSWPKRIANKREKMENVVVLYALSYETSVSTKLHYAYIKYTSERMNITSLDTRMCSEK
jgi:hypothetical protein